MGAIKFLFRRIQAIIIDRPEEKKRFASCKRVSSYRSLKKELERSCFQENTQIVFGKNIEIRKENQKESVLHI